MQDFLAGNAVTLTIALNDAEGNPLTATAVEYEVVDGDEGEVVARIAHPDFTGVETELVVTVGAQHNALTGLTPQVRTIRLFVTTDAGVVLIEEHYRITPESSLAVPSTSLQSYGSALSIGMDLVHVDNWQTASRANRIRALTQARHNIARLRFGNITELSYPDWQSRVSLDASIGYLDDYDATSFANLSEEFRLALKRAQVLEADFLLGSGGGSLWDKLDMGITSETIGETSQTFKGSKRMVRPVSSRAWVVLAKYVDDSVRIGRA